MKRKQFNELSLSDKAWLVYEFGEFLVTIEYYNHKIHLYELNSHFIEIYFNVVLKQVDRISVAEYSDLDKYLSRILVSGLQKRSR